MKDDSNLKLLKNLSSNVGIRRWPHLPPRVSDGVLMPLAHCLLLILPPR